MRRMLIITLLVFIPTLCLAHRYGEKLCRENASYDCYKVKAGESWNSLFPDSHEREMVRLINRMNINLRTGMILAIPHDFSGLDKFALAPFDNYLDTAGQKTIIFDPKEKAWGAYDEWGTLVNWGPAAGGKNYCEDVGSGCRTVVGQFSVQRKLGAGCKSGKFPLPDGGAPMPYCMYFHGGFAFHGSEFVPGYHASHGCVRVFNEHAEWLNQEFVTIGDGGRTKVIVKPY